MKKIWRLAFLAAVLLMVAVGIFTVSMNHGSAHAAAPATASASTSVNASIIRTKTGVTFRRTAITITHGTPFQFLNRTITSQSVTFNGKTILTIKAKSGSSYSFTTAGTYKFGLASNSVATLTVTVQ